MLSSVHHNYLWTIFYYFLTTKTTIQCSNQGLNQVSKCLDTNAAALPGSLLGVLYPRRTDSRQVLSLDATWKFRLVPKLDPEIGFRNKWYAQPLETFGYTNDMDVPGDCGHTVLNSQRMLLYPGWVWFERSFSIPKSWFMMSAGNRIFLRISEAHYFTVVYINGIEVMKHEGGGVPFATELSKSVFTAGQQASDPIDSNNEEGMQGRITVAINNTLTSETIPQGHWVAYGPRFNKSIIYDTRLEAHRDFITYSGIHDSVLLYTTPSTFISDVDVSTDRVDSNGVGYVSYSIQAVAHSGKKCNNLHNSRATSTTGKGLCSFWVQLEDQEGTVVASSTEPSGILTVKEAKLWWPFTTVDNESDVGYLYKFTVSVTDLSTDVKDLYKLNVGIRTIRWTEKALLINERPFYFRGIAEPPAESYSKVLNELHCGNNSPRCSRQMFANSIRKWAQPITEEMMQLADLLGVVIIVQAPTFGLRNYSTVLLATHKSQMRELIQHSKNHASVVAWSLARRPDLQDPTADAYFRDLAQFVRRMDVQARPVTMAVRSVDLTDSYTADYLDIITLSYYNNDYFASSWSQRTPPSGLNMALLQAVEKWWHRMRKPILIGEFGISSGSGFCSGETTVKNLLRFLEEFDYLRLKGLIIGEMNWTYDQYPHLISKDYLLIRETLCTRFAHMAAPEAGQAMKPPSSCRMNLSKRLSSDYDNF